MWCGSYIIREAFLLPTDLRSCQFLPRNTICRVSELTQEKMIQIRCVYCLGVCGRTMAQDKITHRDWARWRSAGKELGAHSSNGMTARTPPKRGGREDATGGSGTCETNLAAGDHPSATWNQMGLVNNQRVSMIEMSTRHTSERRSWGLGSGGWAQTWACMWERVLESGKDAIQEARLDISTCKVESHLMVFQRRCPETQGSHSKTKRRKVQHGKQEDESRQITRGGNYHQWIEAVQYL